MWTFRLYANDMRHVFYYWGDDDHSDRRSMEIFGTRVHQHQVSSIRKSFIETDNSGKCMPFRNCISNGKLAFLFFFFFESKWHTEARTWRVMRRNEKKRKWKRNQLSKAKRSNRTNRKWLLKNLFIQSYAQILNFTSDFSFRLDLGNISNFENFSCIHHSYTCTCNNNQCNTFSSIQLRKT